MDDDQTYTHHNIDVYININGDSYFDIESYKNEQ